MMEDGVTNGVIIWDKKNKIGWYWVNYIGVWIFVKVIKSGFVNWSNIDVLSA